MTKSPQTEADELVEMFRNELMGVLYSPYNTISPINIAIIHVERLIEVIGEMPGSHIEAGLKFVHYQQVLGILKSKN